MIGLWCEGAEAQMASDKTRKMNESTPAYLLRALKENLPQTLVLLSHHPPGRWVVAASGSCLVKGKEGNTVTILK